MHQVKEKVENSVQTKKVCTLVHVCREVWKGSKVCCGRKKFENHCSFDFNKTTTTSALKAILSVLGVGEGIITFSWFCLSYFMLKVTRT